MRNFLNKFLYSFSRFYRLYLCRRYIRFIVWSVIWLWAISAYSRSPILFIVRIILILLYRSHFIFPVKHSKTVEIVIGVPGSGKTSLAALWALKARLTIPDHTVYSNADIKETVDFDWESDYGWFKQENCTIILDEAGLDLDNRNFSFNFTDVHDKKTGDLTHNGRSKLLSLKYHRHLGQTCLVLSQWQDQDKKLVNLAQEFFVCRKTGFHWLSCVQRYDSIIEVDQMTGEFRFSRRKRHTYFIFTPVIWYDFSTESVPFDLPEKDWKVVQ